MLKKLVQVLGPLLILAQGAALSAQTYLFEPLTDRASHHWAAPALEAAMEKLEMERLGQCTKTGASERGALHLFSSLPIDLGEKRSRFYLVFPAKRCDEFFGAHIVSFWIMRSTHGVYDCLLSSSADGIRILKTRSQGLKDLEVVGIRDSTMVHSNPVQFDGHRYARNP